MQKWITKSEFIYLQKNAMKNKKRWWPFKHILFYKYTLWCYNLYKNMWTSCSNNATYNGRFNNSTQHRNDNFHVMITSRYHISWSNLQNDTMTWITSSKLWPCMCDKSPNWLSALNPSIDDSRWTSNGSLVSNNSSIQITSSNKNKIKVYQHFNIKFN